MAQYAYFDQCLRYKNEINEAGIHVNQQPVNGTGGSYTFRPYGSVILATNELVHVGLKTPKRPSVRLFDRLAKEITACTIISIRCPDLLPLLPLFTGYAHDGATTHIVTEDASIGGTSVVTSKNASDETRELLAEGFADLGAFDTIFDSGTMKKTIAFQTGSGERLLDLTPEPYYEKALDVVLGAHQGIFSEAQKLAHELQIRI